MDSIFWILTPSIFILFLFMLHLSKEIFYIKRENRELKLEIFDNKEDLKRYREDNYDTTRRVYDRIISMQSYLRKQSFQVEEIKEEIASNPDKKVQSIMIDPKSFKYNDLNYLKACYTVYEIDDLEYDFKVIYYA